MKQTAAAIVTVVLGGCAQTASPPTSFETIEAPKLRNLENAYDRTKWRWVRNPDGRALLTHTEVDKCFVDPAPPLDSHDPSFSVKRRDTTIGGTRYEVTDVFEKREFWESIYTRAGSREPILGVYAAGRCQQEAERILETYEKALGAKR